MNTLYVELPKPKAKVYDNIYEWYYPEIDYDVIFKKLLKTKSALDKHIGYHPLSFINMMDHSGIWPGDPFFNQQMFQFWNKQFNDEIVIAIMAAMKKKKPNLILDVCAGNGMLAKILTDRGFNVKAVDDYSWKFDKYYFDVEKMDVSKGLEKYNPDFIISSWMPYGTNWTPLFRITKSVQAYMMIGEGENGCCGGNWEEKKG